MSSRAAKRRAARERDRDRVSNFRWAGAPVPPAPAPLTTRAPVKLGLLVLGALMLSLSFAPYKQFYLAPFGLVPWLVVLASSRSQWRALGWSWVAGVLFFAGNMWWLLYVTVPGTFALIAILALYPAAAGWMIRGLGLLRAVDPGTGAADQSPRRAGLRPLLAVFGIAVVWVTVAEWLRATWPFQGLPWLFLGYAQTPALPGCQIADVTGVYGVSFWVMLVNAWAALFFLNRLSARRLVPAGAAVLAVLLGVFGYGAFRLSQKTTYPGPTVLVVQSNYPQSNTGDKGAPLDEIVDFHLKATVRRLDQPNTHVDLVAWSETMVPPVNDQTRAFFLGQSFVSRRHLHGITCENLLNEVLEKDFSFGWL